MLEMMLAALLYTQTAPVVPSRDELVIYANQQPVGKLSREEITLSVLGWPHYDEDKLLKRLNRLAQRMYKAPRNARFDKMGIVIPEQAGLKLNQKAMLQRVLAFYYGQSNQEIQAPVTPIYPKVDRSLLRQLGQKQIGSYVTYYRQHNENRAHNIHLASQAINSHVVFPGETFSFNQVVGRRTPAKGYKPAPIIVKGEFSEDIGGGICQVSSTLFNAVDRAGLKIINRYSHSREVPYVPPGRDATVSWGGPDFSFRNEYSHPVLIRSFSRQGQIVISVYSFEELEYEPRIVPEATKLLPQEVEEITEELEDFHFSPISEVFPD
ncbi:VanW family protein [Brevibacillus ginsengisoli]|uniref:VanW family protein n=1 Tax=Brevibacillus ginsengisoli TaxID=363854 RepID=UPI003CF4097E